MPGVPFWYVYAHSARILEAGLLACSEFLELTIGLCGSRAAKRVISASNMRYDYELAGLMPLKDVVVRPCISTLMSVWQGALFDVRLLLVSEMLYGFHPRCIPRFCIVSGRCFAVAPGSR